MNSIKIMITVLGYFVLMNVANAQQSKYKVTGQVQDMNTKIPLEFVNVYVAELELGTITDSLGQFTLKGILSGPVHIRFSHVGCHTEQLFFNIQNDTILTIELDHHSELLETVIVEGTRSETSNEVSTSVSEEELLRSSNQNLAIILERIPGVSALSTGNGISKPIVHGLSGNRVAIFNNGVQQAGQQWGNDHAPEIDPFSADRMTVVKGAASLAYGGNALGGVVLIESSQIPRDPHLHGKLNYTFETNGRGHTINSRIEKREDKYAWRLGGTLKKIGDQHTPDYYLNNTGRTEANLNIRLEKAFSNKFKTDWYYSLFSTEIGILRGAHIGNLTDLELAFERDEPFYTEDKFSYAIDAPKQKVQHHLFKIDTKYFAGDSSVFKFKYAFQTNVRKEFDVRRSGRSDIPALGLSQIDQVAELIWNVRDKFNYQYQSGILFNHTDNTNDPETGILPLIPDYASVNFAAYGIVNRSFGENHLDFGIRYDAKNHFVAAISRDLPRQVIRFTHNFHNVGLSSGFKKNWSSIVSSRFNLGYLLRSPAINELHSFGLHQGVSGIEKGNSELKAERSFKSVFSLDWNSPKGLFISGQAYVNYISDYIYLQAENEFELTIRGAFPSFQYQQHDAFLSGIDAYLKYESDKHWSIQAKYALIRGHNRTLDTYLVNMPADNYSAAIKYNVEEWRRTFDNEFFLEAEYIARQSRISLDQDFVPAPDAYFLLNLSWNFKLSVLKQNMGVQLKVENLLNTRYRDYLDRFHYYADKNGRNLVIQIQYLL